MVTLLLVLSFFTYASPAQVVKAPDHQAWNTLLEQYVSAEGRVNYAGLKKDQAKLNAYLKTLSGLHPQSSWSRNEQMAFWINAYNAFTVKLILDHSPLTSIMDVDKGKAWDRKWINIGDKTYSLNNIENDILRPQFKDARIHFAVNCAARSCPPLLNKAFTAAQLEDQLNLQARKFINNSRFNQLQGNQAKVSKVFEWYSADFGNLVSFLNRYAKTKLSANAKISYLEYDWALNGL
ncbi:MAG: DUF547 domain-containing protein [Lewinellaceae bacterium]|nr:DUF547 domain-containing protein [Lewinellaceae bacterium]